MGESFSPCDVSLSSSLALTPLQDDGWLPRGEAEASSLKWAQKTQDITVATSIGQAKG